MNEKEFHCMLVIAKAGSIQKAAGILEKNPSSLSRMIRRVEEKLDIILFRRTPSGLIPTPEGEVYLRAAEDILNLYNGLHSR